MGKPLIIMACKKEKRMRIRSADANHADIASVDRPKDGKKRDRTDGQRKSRLESFLHRNGNYCKGPPPKK